MTREEFVESVKTYEELISFCSRHDTDWCGDLYSPVEFSEKVEERIPEWLSSSDWEDLRETLCNLPNSGYDCYEEVDFNVFVGLRNGDSRFKSIKSEVLSWADRDGNIWSEINEPKNNVSTGSDSNGSEPIDEPDFEPQEGCSLDDLLYPEGKL